MEAGRIVERIVNLPDDPELLHVGANNQSWDTNAKACALFMLQAHVLFFMGRNFTSPVPKDSPVGIGLFLLVRLRLTQH